jgi:CRISPR-associated protein Csm1
MDKTNEATEKIVLAALLHDIGQFWQRVDKGNTKTSSILSDAIKKKEDSFCPISKGVRSHTHVLWSAQFILQYESHFRKLIGADYEKFFAAILGQKRPQKDDFWQLVIQKVNQYSLGIGQASEEFKRGRKQTDKGNNRLTSIFENLLENNIDHSFELDVQQLNLTDAYFPVVKGTIHSQDACVQLWEEFITEFEILNGQNLSIKSYTNNLLDLLYRFTSSVPCGSFHLPDVSLFDHLKSSAALSTCMVEWLNEKSKMPDELDISDEPILMIGGDLSGIQSYIYDIISANASKNLKGRSFYLQIIIENVIHYLCREIGLSKASIVYASGGGFFLLAPNTDNVKTKLRQLQKHVTDAIYEQHQTKLFLAFDWIAISENDVLQQKIDNCWKNLFEKLSIKKRQRFKKAFTEKYDSFFEPREEGGLRKRDGITNEEFTEEESNALNNPSLSKYLIGYVDGMPVKKLTYDQIQLGRKLKDIAWWVMTDKPVPNLKDFGLDFLGLGVYNYFLTKEQTENKTYEINKAYLKSIDLPSFALSTATKKFKGIGNEYTFGFYGGNDFPKDKYGEPLTFDQLAEQSQSISKLGVLRMDVDNLGMIFANGFGDKQMTFSRYSTLSRNLDYFFKGYLNTIWQQSEFVQKTFIIYSGGDDLFIIGSWDATLQMAEVIRTKFKEWTCHNSKLSLSGGMVILPGKFPIAKASEIAEKAEKLAKGYAVGQQEKNAFTIFGKPLNWDLDFPIVKEIKIELTTLVEYKNLPRGLLNKLIYYAQTAAYQKEKNLNQSWRWHMAYDFSRAAKRTKDNYAREFYNKIKTAAYCDKWNGIPLKSDYTFLDLLEIAARWSELETK